MTEQCVKVADLLEYCRIAAENCERLRQKSITLLDEAEHKSLSLFSASCSAEEYFSKEYCRWQFDIPNMIRSVADGSWKETCKEGGENERPDETDH